jgi:hypothetical protein
MMRGADIVFYSRNVEADCAFFVSNILTPTQATVGASSRCLPPTSPRIHPSARHTSSIRCATT